MDFFNRLLALNYSDYLKHISSLNLKPEMEHSVQICIEWIASSHKYFELLAMECCQILYHIIDACQNCCPECPRKHLKCGFCFVIKIYVITLTRPGCQSGIMNKVLTLCHGVSQRGRHPTLSIGAWFAALITCTGNSHFTIKYSDVPEDYLNISNA